ncbi:MAG: glutamine--fructose-6-phosphate transaminase (isomerizing), partial [Bacillota bacterium]|nr:glutamine--fructose-6-phosphate transaminase (isomerizing) [Bacillota bacterium]
MCGIVGYAGRQEALPLLLAGLAKLEYRGYDSAGVAVQEPEGLAVVKAEGRLAHLTEHINGQRFTGTVGIGHTRWATHGQPSDENAHPHLDCRGEIAVVHNGIIENYQELGRWLRERGHIFRSQTDTEVLPHLIEEFYQGDLLLAVSRALEKVKGSYALAALHRREPGRIVVARQDSPLVVGLGQEENLVASDIPALLSHTRRVYVLEDGELAAVTPEAVQVFDRQGRPVKKPVLEVQWDVAMAEKGGYEDFMLKEIHEQPRALRDTLAGRLGEGGEVSLDEVKLTTLQVSRLRKIAVVACGTAYHAGLVGKYVLEQLVRLPVEVDLASEFRYRRPLIDADTLAVVISQSGETADTLAGLREAKRAGCRVVAITNVVGSSVAREADDVIYTWAGPEIAVASTKAYLTQLIALYLLALYLGQRRGTIPATQAAEVAAGLRTLPSGVEAVLARAEEVKELARQYKDREDVFFIGRGLDYAVAMEGALKLKEISYIHAEAYAAGELKHGTLALIERGVPVIALATQGALREKMISNMKEVKAREATVIALAPEGAEEVAEAADHVLFLPQRPDFL